ncbi:mini-chromosome maintenance complex-binding protein [Phlebotomus argentipes]|uniref:mini-chromosome maintenance complex-binding protein n=1 Tax=Phlebotomus argentipes TaxID=94469 RepID=UPI0028933C29|nr:mini-chromosome maintenance complex-binding protein [Phlebotomus argentipes]
MPENLEILPSISDYLAGENEYLALLTKPEAWSKIPLLNHAKLPENGSLVRFRGMIQDMLDPEFYLERYIVKTSEGERIQDGRFIDFLQFDEVSEEVDFSSSSNKHGERRCLFLVTIPGINSWADEASFEDEEVPEKRPKVETGGSALSHEYLVNSPLPDRPSRACLTKIYSNFDAFRLNTVVDVLGFLSVDPSLDGSDEEVSNPEEHLARNPPPHLIPRLHAISVREVLQMNPFLQQIPSGENFQDISRDVLMMLTQCLFGDELAARYLFAHLISSIQSRVGLEILGKMCLNITNVPMEYPKSLYGVLEAILPASYHLKMTLDNLNGQQFVPKKDYATGKLTSGVLQLAPKTHLLLDETLMAPGQLESGGIKAVHSLGNLIRHQSIEADFQYYTLDYECDVAVLILSEGKSLLPSDVMLPLKIDPEASQHIEETFKAAHQFIRTKSRSIRDFLAGQKIAQFDLDENIQATVQEDLVAVRKAHNATPEELHGLLTLSRLVGKSLGKRNLDADTWQLVRKMDEERRQRIRK